MASRILTIAVLATLFTVAVPGASALASQYISESSSQALSIPVKETGDNEHRNEVTLGTLAAIGIAGAIATVGYLYRRQVGMLGHYDDGFTPRDTRDHAAH